MCMRANTKGSAASIVEIDLLLMSEVADTSGTHKTPQIAS